MLRDVWAKSPRAGSVTGESLTMHLAATLAAAGKVRDRVGALGAAPAGFWRLVRLAALFHDAGKVAAGFQVMVRGGPNWGQRHEVLSCGWTAGLSDEDRHWVGTGVITHHRGLTGPAGQEIFSLYGEDDSAVFADRFGHVDCELAGELAAWLAGTAGAAGLLPDQAAGAQVADPAGAAHAVLSELRQHWEGPVSQAEGLTGVLLQGAVTMADHLSSAHGRLHSMQPFSAAYALALAARMDLHDHQKQAGEVDGHLLLRAPTGSGKTEAAQLWAARQVEAIQAARGGLPRVFYTLPYLASINAMAARLGDDLGDEGLVGVSHSRAASYHLSRSLCDDEPEHAARKSVSRDAATRLFRELVRVGTPYQLLRGALAGTAASSIILDSANSVFILDELHAYDPRRLGYILAMAGFWERLGGRIAVLSATCPSVLGDLLGETLQQPVTTVEAMDQPWPVRHRLAVRDAHLTSTAAVREIEDRIRAGQAVAVVANSVKDARSLYARLAPVARDSHGDDAAILLHSRFRQMDRTVIEDRIRGRYGTGQPRWPGVVVATQVVEVSLDVDFDCLYTSGAPLEALTQRAGRVNRLGQRPPADVIVCQPAYTTRRGEEYADSVYAADPVRLAMDIIARHDGQLLGERQLDGWLDHIYQSAWGEGWRRAVDRHRRAFSRAFLRFDMPFDDRSHLAAEFDKLFDGTEAILADDREAYAEALSDAGGRAGKLLGSQYLIPLPAWGSRQSRYDKEIGVNVITADYDAVGGLGAIHRPCEGSQHEEQRPPGARSGA